MHPGSWGGSLLVCGSVACRLKAPLHAPHDAPLLAVEAGGVCQPPLRPRWQNAPSHAPLLSLQSAGTHAMAWS